MKSRATLLIVAFMVSPAWGQSVEFKQPLSPENVLVSQYWEAKVRQCSETNAQLQGVLEELRRRIEKPVVVEPAAIKKPANKARKAKRTRCKPGRTRNARGICGRWK